MLRIAICDDDSREHTEILAQVAKYGDRHPEMELLTQVFSDGISLLSALERGEDFDVYLMDIVMPVTDGLDTARALRAKGGKGALIFLTASPDYALEAFRVWALQYLLKPVSAEELFAALDRAVAGRARPEERRFTVHTSTGTTQVRFSDITYVECIRHVVCVHLEDGTSLTSRTLRVPFTKAMAPLLEDGRFLHPHKSFLINMERVDTLAPSAFLMVDSGRVPIPKNKAPAVRAAYLEFLSGEPAGGGDVIRP